MVWLFRGLPTGLVFLSSLRTLADLGYFGFLWAAENKIGLSGLLQCLGMFYKQTDTRGSKKLQALEKETRGPLTSIIEKLNTKPRKMHSHKRFERPSEFLVRLIGEDLHYTKKVHEDWGKLLFSQMHKSLQQKQKSQGTRTK